MGTGSQHLAISHTGLYESHFEPIPRHRDALGWIYPHVRRVFDLDDAWVHRPE